MQSLLNKIRVVINSLVTLLSLYIIVFHIYIFLQPEYLLKFYTVTFKSNWLVLAINIGTFIGVFFQLLNKKYFLNSLSFFLHGYLLTIIFDYFINNQHPFWIYCGYILLIIAAIILNKLIFKTKALIFFLFWLIAILLLINISDISLIF